MTPPRDGYFGGWRLVHACVTCVCVRRRLFLGSYELTCRGARLGALARAKCEENMASAAASGSQILPLGTRRDT